MQTELSTTAPGVVTAGRGWVYGLDRATGEVRGSVRVWDDACDGHAGIGVEIAVLSDRVLAASWYCDDVVCIAYPSGRETGRVRFDLPGNRRPTLLVDGDLFFVAREGHVQCFTLDGQPLWRQPFEGLGPGGCVALGVPGHVRVSDDRRE